ncbi:MAG: adenylate/guanylate cyclase domain-containing protein [Dermatophilaceae bacterium]
MTQALDHLDAGRAAAAQGRWPLAYEEFSLADPPTLSGADILSFADAAWWSGHADQAIELRERAHSALVAGGDTRAAARVAILLAWDHAARGVMSVYQGWMAKAERLLADAKDTPEYAYFVTTRGFTSMEMGETDKALPDLELAEELGARFDNREVQAIARIAKGRILVHSGRVEEGLALLDEASAAAVSGELEPFEAGVVYCVTISACHEVGDLRRAAEWTEAANRWCDRHDLTGFPGACRVHRAQVLRMRGLWSDAEVQCQAACAELQDYNRWITAEGLYEIGEIRRRRGEFASALEAYRSAAEIGVEPQPGLSLLRLAEGKVDAALSGLRRGLDETQAPLPRVQLLPALVEVALAAGDVGTARTALEELGSTVATYRIGAAPAPAFEAQHRVAAGRIHLAEGDLAGAGRSLREARTLWRQVGAPYEVAQVRLLLGLAYRRQGDEESAMAELEAAEATFQRLGARLDEERAKELLGRLETRRTFMFTDIVGSTSMLESLGDEKWRRLLGRHDELLRERIVDAGGEVIKQTGDGFFAAFDRPQAALLAAVAIQRALTEEIVAPDVRIGVHTGGAFHPQGDDADYAGQGVHMAARIGAAAGAGEILVSTQSLEGVADTGSLGEARDLELKGFTDPVRVSSVQWR